MSLLRTTRTVRARNDADGRGGGVGDCVYRRDYDGDGDEMEVKGRRRTELPGGFP